MTQREVLKAIRAMGLTVGRTPYGEYRINFKAADGGTEDSATYTEDNADAYGTALHMVGILPARRASQLVKSFTGCDVSEDKANKRRR